MSKLTQSRFKFKNPIIENVHFQKNLKFNQDEEVVDFLPNAEMNVEIVEGDKATAKLSFSIGQESKNPYFFFSAIASAEFKWEDMTTEEAKKQLHVSGAAVLISYIRPLLSSLTVQSGLPPYQLPFVDFSQFK